MSAADLDDPAEQKAVAQGKEDVLYPGVGLDVVVESLETGRVVVGSRVGDKYLSAPHHVVDKDNASFAHAGHEEVVMMAGGGLVGIDKCKVDIVAQGGDDRLGIGYVETDLIGEMGLGEIPSDDGLALFVDLYGMKGPLGGQSAGDADSTVSDKGAYLYGFKGPGHRGEELQQLSLIGAGSHAGLGPIEMNPAIELIENPIGLGGMLFGIAGGVFPIYYGIHLTTTF